MPCPFCGCEIITETEHEYEGDKFYSRDCPGCGAGTNWFSIRRQATDAWNNRVPNGELAFKPLTHAEIPGVNATGLIKNDNGAIIGYLNVEDK